MRKSAQIALAACFIALSAVAQTTPHANIEWQTIRNNQPAELSLKLELTGTTFRRGDVINATLAFSNNSTATPYHLWTGKYDYSGRIPDIAFYATGSDGKPAADPLRWYFERGGMGGGMGNTMDLGQWQIMLPANQWLRFDKPGVYRLFAYSNRVQKGDRFARDGQGNRVELVSDPINITIDPLSPAEEEQIISRARQDLGSDNKTAAQAVTTLRYLDTPASRAVLLPLLADPRFFDAGAGLLAAPDPAKEAADILAAVREGRLKLIQTLYLYTTLKTSGYQFGPGSAATEKEREALRSKFMTDVHSAQVEIADAAIAASGTEGPDYHDILITMLGPAPEMSRAKLVKAQLDLTPAQDNQILENWSMFGGADFFPLVRKAAGPPDYNATALKLLTQSRPDEARPLIIADMLRPKSLYYHPGFGSSNNEALLSLPKAPIPEIESYFRSQLAARPEQRNLDLLVPAIDRYGIPSILPDVVKLYTDREGIWSCSMQAELLRYWIRYDPATGVEALKRALYSRESTHCYTKVLSDVFLDEWNDTALPVVTAALADSDPEVVASAIAVLDRHASDKWLAPSIGAIRRISTLATKDNLHATQDAARTLLQSTRWTLNPAQRQELQGYESLQAR